MTWMKSKAADFVLEVKVLLVLVETILARFSSVLAATLRIWSMLVAGRGA